MKKALLLFLFISIFISSHSQTLFTYGHHPVSASEFLRAYSKNKTDVQDKEKALRDYLNLYTLFKLKVQAARDAHLDTLPALQADLQSYRSQVEENYLKDDNKVNALINEAFDRSAKDIHVLDYYIELPANGDTTQYIKLVTEVQQQLKSAKKPVAQIIADAKAKEINLTENDLGFVTVFTLPYHFENTVYQLKTGEVSSAIRTKKGWHLLKKIEERPAAGNVKLAQILIAVPEGFIDARAHAKKLADSLYAALQAGAEFAALAKQFSDDRTTYMNGGEMPEFGVAKYTPDFEKQAFALKKDNEISKPFETSFGYHIIKRISATPVPDSKNDEAFMYALKEEVMRDSRIESASKQFIETILPKIGLQKNKINEGDLGRVSDSSLLANKNIHSGKVGEETILFSFNDQSHIQVSDWILYLRNSGKVVPGQIHESYKNTWPDFIAFAAKENYRKRLRDFDPEFKTQIKEFEEGNMLFEIMERKVWGKAATDSAGLLNYYNQHSSRYSWDVSADAIMFSSANENIANNAIQNLKAGKNWKEVVNENPTLIQGDSARFELGQIPVVDRTNFTPGLITASVVNKNDGTVVFTKIIKIYPGNEPRNFGDARGLVINDYQNVLEEKWMNTLKKQYPIKINEKVFQTLLK